MRSVSTLGIGAAAALLLFGGLAQADDAWTQWGGPDRDFTCADEGLAAAWPESGPRVIWSRELGAESTPINAHSSILYEDGRLYTMYRDGEKDVIAALDAKTGKTIWKHAYAAPWDGTDFGKGPHATPLIVGDRLFTVGASGIFHCVNKADGAVQWSKDLQKDFGISLMNFGYSPSPIAWKDNVIISVGGGEYGLVSLKQSDGELVWKGEKLPPSQVSPIIETIHDTPQVIAANGKERIGVNPDTGATLWKMTVSNDKSGSIMATPLFVEPDKIFCTAAYGAGSRLIQINRTDDGFDAEELWFDKRMKVQHATVVQLNDDLVFGCSGDFGPCFLMAVRLDDGKVLWRERGFTKANVVKAGDKLILLDEEGKLALATADAEGIKIHSQVKMMEERAWTCPTLIGTTLYLRDYKTIKALDLSKAGNQS